MASIDDPVDWVLQPKCNPAASLAIAPLLDTCPRADNATMYETAEEWLDAEKSVAGDIRWTPAGRAWIFEAQLITEHGYQYRVVGRRNVAAGKLSFVVIQPGRPGITKRVYALDIGVAHKDCGKLHKHRWDDVYEPDDITATDSQVTKAWEEFCDEAGITHDADFVAPPEQLGFV